MLIFWGQDYGNDLRRERRKMEQEEKMEEKRLKRWNFPQSNSTQLSMY